MSRDSEFLLRFFLESDAIEGIGNDPSALRFLLERGESAGSYALPGHLRALLFLRERAGTTLSADEQLVKTVQQLIVGDQHLRGERKIPVSQRGEWRTCNIDLVSGATGSRRRIGSDWEHVPSDMAMWCMDAHALDAACRKQPPLQTVTAIARLHWRYERIHPFVDGNGRSGRAMVYYQYLRAGLTPFVFTANDRGERYYPCFQSAHPVKMERYFLDRTEFRTA